MSSGVCTRRWSIRTHHIASLSDGDQSVRLSIELCRPVAVHHGSSAGVGRSLEPQHHHGYVLRWTKHAYWLKLGLGEQYFPVVSRRQHLNANVQLEDLLKMKQGVIPGCTVETAQVSPGQLFALEYMFALGLMFLAFGVGLDPRQGKNLGPALSPILVGVTLGFATLASSAAKPGYTGVCE